MSLIIRLNFTSFKKLLTIKITFQLSCLNLTHKVCAEHTLTSLQESQLRDLTCNYLRLGWVRSIYSGRLG